jgi:anti-sigma B factor antagonist
VALEVETQDSNGAVRVVLTGELDIATTPELEEALARIEKGAPKQIVLDLRGLEFLDSTGLRALVGADARAREADRRLSIVRGPDAVNRIFAVTRLDERLDIIDAPPAA